MRSIPILFALLFASTSFGADNLSTFKEVEPYKNGSKQRQCANYSNDSWRVKFDEKSSKVVLTEDKTTPTSLEIKGDIFFGSDGGEFGGDLKLTSNGTTQTLVNKNISALIQISPEYVVALGGIAHMNTDVGNAWLITKKIRNQWTIEKTISLGANPYASTLSQNGNILIATNEGLLQIDPSTRKRTTIYSADYSGLYPNSIAIDPSGTVFIGMRHTVVQLKPKGSTYEEKWLVKKPCK